MRCTTSPYSDVENENNCWNNEYKINNAKDAINKANTLKKMVLIVWKTVNSFNSLIVKKNNTAIHT